MTPADRASLAKIASFGLFEGRNDSEIEATLRQYVSTLTAEQVDRALREGVAGQVWRNELNLGGAATDVVAPTQEAGETVREYHLSVRFQIGPSDETDWRQITLNVPAGSTRSQAEQAIQNAITEAISDTGERRAGTNRPGAQLQAGSENVVYAVPVFSQG